MLVTQSYPFIGTSSPPSGVLSTSTIPTTTAPRNQNGNPLKKRRMESSGTKDGNITPPTTSPSQVSPPIIPTAKQAMSSRWTNSFSIDAIMNSSRIGEKKAPGLDMTKLGHKSASQSQFLHHFRNVSTVTSNQYHTSPLTGHLTHNGMFNYICSFAKNGFLSLPSANKHCKNTVKPSFGPKGWCRRHSLSPSRWPRHPFNFYVSIFIATTFLPLSLDVPVCFSRTVDKVRVWNQKVKPAAAATVEKKILETEWSKGREGETTVSRRVKGTNWFLITRLTWRMYQELFSLWTVFI